MRLGQQRIERLAPVPPIIEPNGTAKRLLTYPITYIQELFELVSGPKSFIARRQAERMLTIEQTFGFFALSAIIIMFLPPVTLSSIASDILFVPIESIFFAFAIFLAWRLVGGSAKLLDYIPILFYYTAVFQFLKVVSNRIWWGALRIIDEHLYHSTMKTIKSNSGFELIPELTT